MKEEALSTVDTPRRSPSGLQQRWPASAWIFCAAIFCWALLAWFVWRAERPVFDWMSWRQADTQSIARNFTEPGSNWLWPRIAWGGDGPGYVETEFQLYTGLVSLLLKAFGENEWAGQLLSLACGVLTASLIAWSLQRRLGTLPALAGVLGWLSVRSVLLLSTAVMPDMLAVLLYVAAWSGLCAYLAPAGTLHRPAPSLATHPSDGARRLGLVIFGVCGALAMLVKPTTAHLGISSAVLVLLSRRQELARARIWVVWVLMLSALALFLLHARQLYVTYGNTFGILSGGDSKSPKLEHLLMPRLQALVAWRFISFGLGPLGALALLALVWQLLSSWLRHRRTELRQTASDPRSLQLGADAQWVALLVGNLAIVPVSFRYLANGAGAHYLAPASLLGAIAIAEVVARLPDAMTRVGTGFKAKPGLHSRLRHWAYLAIGCALGVQLVLGIRLRCLSNLDAQSVMLAELGARVAGYAHAAGVAPGSSQRGLLLVRTLENEFDAFYGTPNNFEDPRVFYAARMRGFAVGADMDDPARLEHARLRGARFYVDSALTSRGPRTEAWLREHAQAIDNAPLSLNTQAMSAASKPSASSNAQASSASLERRIYRLTP